MRTKMTKESKSSEFRIPSARTSQDHDHKSDKKVRKKQWNWSNMMKMKIGTTPFLKLERPEFPSVQFLGQHMNPPAVFSTTIELDEGESNEMYEDFEIAEKFSCIG